MRVRFMLLTMEQANKLPSRVTGAARPFLRIFRFLEDSLRYAHLRITPEAYLAAAFVSAGLYALVLGLLFLGVGFISPDGGLENGIKLGVVAGVVAGMSALGLHLIYPRLLAQKNAVEVDQSLTYALKSLLIQVNSGVGLYDAMSNVARAGYGHISEEFEVVVQEINAGVTEAAALERLALRTDSHFLKKVVWQLVTSIRTGSSVSAALQAISQSLSDFQSRHIKDYAAELNMWILIYLLIAAAVPTIGITFLVILSSIGGTSVGNDTIFMTIGFAFIIQVLLIGFIGTRIPAGYKE
ncbi:MAG: type II secretion system F family protein [Candidatus Diapherotrites archaeon]|nr:type II secretion system F family protein [Candidatus Diapherotrites archaeon]MDZ4256578.1 type II secretion system F family protein [archaeon]